MTYSQEPHICKTPLPDLFQAPGMKQRVDAVSDWPQVAAAWRDLIVDLEYGGMPPQPTSIRFEALSTNVRRAWDGKPDYLGYRIHCEGGARPFSFTIKILIPQSEEPVPVIINGDACWWRSEEIAREVVGRNCALVIFDRCECARDVNEVDKRKERAGGLYDIYPEHTFGALSAWAWAYQRVVDFLYTLPRIDHEKIAVTGHSRGGKTVLLAALTDERITLINDNASCAGGGALFRYVGNGGETIAIADHFYDWFNPAMLKYIGKEEDLPFDQHCLLAALAPRPLLLTYALDDRWSNPEGMVQCVWAAQKAYTFLQADDRIAFHLRPGVHAHNIDDWHVLFDFIDHHWFGKDIQSPLNEHPYGHLQPMAD